MGFPIHEDYWDRPFAGNDTTNHIPHVLGHVLGGFFRALCHVLWRLRVEGRDIVRALQGKERGCVLVAPHTSFLDVVISYVSIRPDGWLRLMARDTLFEAAHGFMGMIFSSVGAFPVKREAADRTALKRAQRMLKNGEWVGIYPEGTRRGKGTGDLELHAGAALIARLAKAPIVPFGMQGVADVKRKGERVRFPKIVARYGRPIMVSAFDFLPKADRLDACTWYVMREAFALSRGCAAEDVDMVILFPNGRDFTEVFAGVEIPRVDPADLPDYHPKGA